MPHATSLAQRLRALLLQRRTAALATLSAEPPEQGEGAAAPCASMVPYAIDAHSGTLVLHLSGLAAHTRQLGLHPLASLLVVSPEPEQGPVHALERVTLQVRAHTPERNSAAWHAARTAYLARFPEAAFMMELGDFRLVCLTLLAARHIAGFGAARDVPADELRTTLQQCAMDATDGTSAPAAPPKDHVPPGS